jgi:hypothetical protein
VFANPNVSPASSMALRISYAIVSIVTSLKLARKTRIFQFIHNPEGPTDFERSVCHAALMLYFPQSRNRGEARATGPDVMHRCEVPE